MDKQQQDHASTERDLLARWVKWTQEFWSIRPEGVELVEQTRFLLSRPPQPPSASDDDDECTHEFVMFQSACVRCGQPYEETPSASDERAGFEAWCRTRPEITDWSRGPDGQYQKVFTQRAWEAWEERSRLPAGAAPAPVYTIQVRGALHTWTATKDAFGLGNGTYNLYAVRQP